MRFTNYQPFYEDMTSQNVEYAAERTISLSFDAVEILAMNKDTEPLKKLEDARAARRILDANALPVSCYSLGANILARNREDSLRFFKHHADMAAEMGSPYFHHTIVTELVWLDIFPKYSEVFASVIDMVEDVAKYANGLGLTALYEPQGMYFNGVEGLSRLYTELTERGCNVGICYDLGNPYFRDTDPVDIGNAFSNAVKHIHVKDYLCLDDPVEGAEGYKSREGKYLYNAMTGDGVVNFKGCFDSLKCYTGDVSFEISGSDTEIKNAIKYIRSFFN